MVTGGDFTIKLTGLTDLQRVLAGAGAKSMDVLEQALVQECQLVMLESQKQVPVMFGPLKGSATQRPPVRSGSTITIVLGYGGAASKYAVHVHNSPYEKHWTKPGTKSHFLSDPLQARLHNIEATLTERIRNML